jgi:hypothetical protein
MGNVFFNTDVEKTVNIFKTVDLFVTKDVFSFVDLTGNLATAEASADAIGGTSGGPGGQDFRDFAIDLFNDYQEVTQDNGLPDPNVGMARSDGSTAFPPFSPSIRATPPNPAEPDGANFTNDPLDPNYSTDIPSVAQRTITVDDDSPLVPGPGTTTTVVDDGPTEPGNSIARFSTDIDTLADTAFLYNADIDGDSVFGEPDDAFSVLVDCPDGIDLSDPENALILDNLSVDPGIGTDVTLRFEATIEDALGNAATLRLYATDAAVSSQDLILPLGLFTGEFTTPAGAPVLNLSTPDPTDVFVGLFGAGDSPNAALDFDQITNITFKVLGNTANFGSPIVDPNPYDPLLPAENPTEEAYDASADNLRIESVCGTPPGGNLAETDTFAQVTEDGAFSFSESLAAFDPAEADMIIT